MMQRLRGCRSRLPKPVNLSAAFPRVALWAWKTEAEFPTVEALPIQLGSALHLELPDGELYGSAAHWVRPYQAAFAAASACRSRLLIQYRR